MKAFDEKFALFSIKHFAISLRLLVSSGIGALRKASTESGKDFTHICLVEISFQIVWKSPCSKQGIFGDLIIASSIPVNEDRTRPTKLFAHLISRKEDAILKWVKFETL